MITPLLTREASLGEKAATNTGSKAKAHMYENQFGLERRLSACTRQIEKTCYSLKKPLARPLFFLLLSFRPRPMKGQIPDELSGNRKIEFKSREPEEILKEAMKAIHRKKTAKSGQASFRSG